MKHEDVIRLRYSLSKRTTSELFGALASVCSGNDRLLMMLADAAGVVTSSGDDGEDDLLAVTAVIAETIDRRIPLDGTFDGVTLDRLLELHRQEAAK